MDISNTILNSFRLPKIIHDLDFKSLVPKYKDRRSGLYLLMAVSGFYLDFHIEQSGSAVWYYCYDGDLSFYLICPNEENLELFKDWYENNSIDSGVLYTDVCDNDGNTMKEKIITITLKEGDFMIIPSGWIYCFYCSSNAILFSGNFLHGFDLLIELYVRDLEETLKYPDHILYENFQEELWHGCQKYLGLLRLMSFNNNNNMISSYELNGLPSLICSLSNWFQCLSDESDNDNYDNSIREAANNASIATHCNGPLDMLSELITRLRKEQWKERNTTLPKISYSIESETTMQQVLGDDDNNSDSDDSDDDESNNNKNNNIHTIGKAPPIGLIGGGKYIPANNNNNNNSDSDDSDDSENDSDDILPSSLPSSYFVDCICGLRGMNLKDDLPLVQCCVCQVYFHKEHVLQTSFNNNNNNENYYYYCHKCKEKQQQNEINISYSQKPPDLPPKPPALPPKPIIINNNTRNNNRNKQVVKINENNNILLDDNNYTSTKKRRRSFQKDYDIDDDYVEKEEEYVYNKDNDGDNNDDEDYGSGDEDEKNKKKKNTKKKRRTNYYVTQINSNRKAQKQNAVIPGSNIISPPLQPPPVPKKKKERPAKKESSFKNIMKNLKRKKD